MKNLKTEAVIIHSIPLKENDIIIRTYTKEFGKISVVVKGCRKNKSKRAALVQCGNVVQLTLTKHLNSELFILNSISKIYNNSLIGCSYKDLKALSLWWEIIIKCIVDPEPNFKLYKLNVDIIRSISEKKIDRRIILISVILKFINICGFFPEIDKCVVCLNKPDELFNVEFGGLVCKKCINGNEIEFNYGKITLIKKLFLWDIDKELNFSISEKLLDSFMQFLINYINYYFEVELKIL